MIYMSTPGDEFYELKKKFSNYMALKEPVMDRTFTTFQQEYKTMGPVFLQFKPQCI